MWRKFVIKLGGIITLNDKIHLVYRRLECLSEKLRTFSNSS